MRKAVAQLVVLLLLTPLATHARDRDPFSFSEAGVLPSGRSYSLRIEERPFVPRPGEAADDGSRWGIDGGFPGTYCAVFELAVEGREVHLIRKLYEDLSHLSDVTVGEDGNAVRIEIRGGDAAGSFRAVFTVAPHEVVREVRHGEAPETIWERLVVHNEEGEVPFDDEVGWRPESR